MDWANESYVRMYTRRTIGDQLLSWQARALWHEMLREFDRAGVIEVGAHGARGLAVAVRMPADVVEAALEELVRDGRLELRGDWLFAPNFYPAQTAERSQKQRARDHRLKVAGERRLKEIPRRQLLFPEFSEPANGHVTPLDAGVTSVTSTPGARHSVLCSAVLTSALEEERECATPGGVADTSLGSDFGIAEGTKPNGRANGAGRERAPTAAEREIAERILRKLSERAKRRYTGDAHVRLVVRLLRQGHTEREIKLVIWDRANEWQGDEKMDRYVRPKTLFAPSNFADYLPEAEAAYAKQAAPGSNGASR